MIISICLSRFSYTFNSAQRYFHAFYQANKHINILGA